MACHVLHLDKILSHMVETDTTIAFGKHDKQDILSALSHAHGHLDIMFSVTPKGGKYAVKWHTAQFKDESHDASEMSWWTAMLLMYRHNITCKVTTKEWDMTHSLDESSHTRQGRARHITQKPLGFFNTIKHYKAKMGDPFDTFMRHKCAQISFYLDLPLFKKLLGLKCTMTWDHHSVGEHVRITFHGSSQGETTISANKMRSGMVRYIRSPKGILTKHDKSCRDVVAESVESQTQVTNKKPKATNNNPTNNKPNKGNEANNNSKSNASTETNNNNRKPNLGDQERQDTSKPELHNRQQQLQRQGSGSTPGHWSPVSKSLSKGIAGASFWSSKSPTAPPHNQVANGLSQQLTEVTRQLSQRKREGRELVQTRNVQDPELQSLVMNDRKRAIVMDAARRFMGAAKK